MLFDEDKNIKKKQFVKSCIRKISVRHEMFGKAYFIQNCYKGAVTMKREQLNSWGLFYKKTLFPKNFNKYILVSQTIYTNEYCWKW
jgi:hypothetical protein